MYYKLVTQPPTVFASDNKERSGMIAFFTWLAFAFLAPASFSVTKTTENIIYYEQTKDIRINTKLKSRIAT